MNREIVAHAQHVGEKLLQWRGWLATIESCTGGLLAASITAIPGSSHYFERGWVVYSNAAKQDELGVPAAILEKFGAVSEETTSALVKGALQRLAPQQLMTIAVSGVAGPGGGSARHPVGTVCFSIGWRGLVGEEIFSTTCHFTGERAAIREQAVKQALQLIIACQL